MSAGTAANATTGQRVPNGMLEANYPRNMWWVAGWSEEITDKPLGRRLLDMPVVLYRMSDGSVAALDDRCPHRWAPLSAGRVQADEIVCPYHGLRFSGSSGRCTLVPTQEIVPSTLNVRSYKVIEQYGVVWIWMGDPSKAETAPPPVDHFFTSDPQWSTLKGYFVLESNYMLLRENVLDLTHFPFLHETSFRQNDWVIIPEVETAESTVLYRASFKNSPLTGVFSKAMGMPPGKVVDRVQIGELLTPAIHFSTWTVHDPAPEEGHRSDFILRVTHITTPISPDRTHYFWTASFDVPNVDAEIMEETREGVVGAFSEDIWMLNAIQSHVRSDPRGLDFPEAILGADKAGVHARRIVNKYLADERQ